MVSQLLSWEGLKNKSSIKEISFYGVFNSIKYFQLLCGLLGTVKHIMSAKLILLLYLLFELFYFKSPLKMLWKQCTLKQILYKMAEVSQEYKKVQSFSYKTAIFSRQLSENVGEKPK